MSTKSYIPANNAEFLAFEENLNAEVASNAVSWSIPATEATALDTWSVGYRPLYEKIQNKNTRTREQVLAHDEYRKDFVAFLRPFCQSFLVNNILIPMSQRVAMGFSPRGLNPPSERPLITSAPIPSLKPLGGGMVKYTFKVADSNSRTARHPDSNGVEVYYRLEDLVKEPQPLNDTLINEEPEPSKDGMSFDNMFSTRAQFINELGLDNVGKRLTVYARWVNTTDPSKSGPYSATASMVIS